MGPLETSKDDLIKELAGYSSSGSAGASATGGEKSPGLAAAIISVLGNVGSTLLANRLTQRRAEWQNQQNIAQWQRENAYNTPVAQMARLAAAGINPALAYANGNVMNEAASSPQLTSGQVMSPVQFDPMMAAQINLMDAQAEQARANAGAAVVDADIKKIEKAVRTMDYNSMKEAFDSGLYQRWYEGNLGNDISKSRLTNLEYFESAWNLAILFGSNPADLDLASNIPGGRDEVSFSFTQEAWDRAKKLFVGQQNLGITENEVDQFMSRLEKEMHEKDMDFWQSLNKECEDPDNWFARLLRFGLMMLAGRSGSRSLSLKFPGKKIVNNSVKNMNESHFKNQIINKQ